MEGDKRKILIVDDDTFLLDMYAFKFSQNNFEVYTAPSALQVIEKLKDGLKPDIILMDIIMPDMDGFEMLEKINNDNLSPNSTKIILSIFSYRGLFVSFNFCINALVTKPPLL